MASSGHTPMMLRRSVRPRARRSCVVTLAITLVGGCSDTPEPELPDPPDGAELVLEVGDLEVYQVFDGELCAGTLRRIELHANGLAGLFDMDPPRARVFLYDDVEALNKTLDDVCHFPVETHGCTQWWGAYATPDVVTHELVHVFVNAATGVRTRPAIQEGVAWALQGDWDVPGDSAQTYEELETQLVMHSPFGLVDAGGDAHLFAWAIDRFGAQAVLDAHVATAHATTDDEVEAALAGSFGFDTLPDLYVEYEATRASFYPPIMDVAKVFTSEELAAGTMLDTSCAGAYTEGPTDGATVLRALLDVSQAGEYTIASGALWLGGCPPLWRPSEPVFAWPDNNLWQALSCSYDQDPPHFVFHLGGHHEVALDDADLLGCDMPQPPLQVSLSMQYLNGGGECSWP
ncbi:MAG TPA: hypothetical protein VFG69_14595 [Nannocystaceae bacterium]|nr:hypothetical protein [Nannocystaceae bacterium]